MVGADVQKNVVIKLDIIAENEKNIRMVQDRISQLTGNIALQQAKIDSLTKTWNKHRSGVSNASKKYNDALAPVRDIQSEYAGLSEQLLALQGDSGAMTKERAAEISNLEYQRKELTKEASSYQAMAQPMQANIANSKRLTAKTAQSISAKKQQLAISQRELNSQNKRLKAYQKEQKALNSAKKATKGFRMEFLSTMFAGMALYKAMTALLKPAFEAVGIFDLISATLTILFLPIALKVLDFVLVISDKLMGMSEKWKMIWGAIVLVAAGFGLFLMFASQVMLFLGGIGLAISSLLWFLIPLGVIIFALSIYFFNLSTGIGTVSAATDDLSGNLEKTPSLFNNLIDKITSFYDKIQQARSEGNLGAIIYETISSGVLSVINFLTTNIPKFIEQGGKILLALIQGIINTLPMIITAVISIITSIINLISANITPLIDAAITIINAIVKGIVDNWDKIRPAIDVLVNGIGKLLDEYGPQLWDIGTDLIIGFGKMLIDIITTNPIMGMVTGAIIGSIFGPLGALIGGAIGIVVGGIGTAISSLSMSDEEYNKAYGPKKKKYKSGGIVPGNAGQAVPIIAHGGERIIPNSGSAENSSGGTYNYSPVINVQAAVSSDVDIRRLATELNKYWVQDFERMTKSRTTL